MGGKWLDIIRQISPGVKRVGVLYNPQVGPFGKLYAQAVSEAGMTANIRIEVAQVDDTNGMELFVDSLSPDHEALIVLPDIFTVTHQKAIITKVAQRRLLTIYPFPYFVNAGGIVAYGVDQRDLFRRSASYVDKVLTRGKPFRASGSAACNVQACREFKGREDPGNITPRDVGRGRRRHH